MKESCPGHLGTRVERTLSEQGSPDVLVHSGKRQTCFSRCNGLLQQTPDVTSAALGSLASLLSSPLCLPRWMAVQRRAHAGPGRLNSSPVCIVIFIILIIFLIYFPGLLILSAEKLETILMTKYFAVYYFTYFF